MLVFLVEITTKFEETSQIYMKYYRHGYKILPETTNYSTKKVAER